MKKISKKIFFFIVIILFISILPINKIFDYSKKIGLIVVDYPISSSEQFNKDLDYLVDRGDINSIIIKLNTPGGGVAASQEIYNRIKSTKEDYDIEFISSVEGIAASGGYYVAIATDKIFANSGSITGSIGVIMEYPVVKDLLDVIGIEFQTVKSSTFKDSGSPFREMTLIETEYFQELINDLYDQFVEEVSKQRDIPKDQLLNIADGKVFSGRQALNLNLIDTLGSFHDAIDYIKDKNNFEKVKIVERVDKKRSFFDFIFNVLSNKLGTTNSNYIIPQYLIVN